MHGEKAITVNDVDLMPLVKVTSRGLPARQPPAWETVAGRDTLYALIQGNCSDLFTLRLLIEGSRVGSRGA